MGEEERERELGKEREDKNREEKKGKAKTSYKSMPSDRTIRR